MSVKTISVEQIAAPVLLTGELASARIGPGYSLTSSSACESAAGSGVRLSKNKSYSFLISRSSTAKQREFTNNSSDSGLDAGRATSISSADTFTSSSSRRNFFKSRLS